jgi:hypothetical protein
MRVKKTLFFTLLAVLTVVTAQSALAILSSGDVYYHENGLNGYIKYAVYESRDEYETAWSGLGFSAPGDGQYVYAYQIFNDLVSADVAHFALFGLTEDNTSGLGSEDREDGGVQPSDCYLDGDESKGVWKWSDGEGGYGYIKVDEHSWLLVFSSDYSPVKGDFEIKGPEGIDVPGDIPEPSMIALLGAGGVLFLRRRKEAK